MHVISMQGDIQQLLIVDDPGAAETYCQDYIPDCDMPLPYNSILTEPEEVRAGRVETCLKICKATGQESHL